MRKDEIKDRAPYALGPGDAALERPLSQTRRRLLLGSLGFGLAGLVVGGRLSERLRASDTAGRAASRSDERLQWARTVSVGRLETLTAAWPTFLSVLARYGSRDPSLWNGWRRIAWAVLDDPNFTNRQHCIAVLVDRVREASSDVRLALEPEVRRLREVQ